MTTVYICDKCGRAYSKWQNARYCEINHEVNPAKKKAFLIKHEGSDPCDYCARAYYVYGCERNCDCEKNCIDFDLFVFKE